MSSIYDSMSHLTTVKTSKGKVTDTYKELIPFSQDVLFIGFNIFCQVIVMGLHLIKNISSGFNIYQ